MSVVEWERERANRGRLFNNPRLRATCEGHWWWGHVHGNRYLRILHEFFFFFFSFSLFLLSSLSYKAKKPPKASWRWPFNTCCYRVAAALPTMLPQLLLRLWNKLLIIKIHLLATLADLQSPPWTPEILKKNHQDSRFSQTKNFPRFISIEIGENL